MSFIIIITSSKVIVEGHLQSTQLTIGSVYNYLLTLVFTAIGW